jgi:putative transposon-encoded protein
MYGMRKVRIKKEELLLSDAVDAFFEKRVTKFGTGAKIDCPREYLGRRVYVVICKE